MKNIVIFCCNVQCVEVEIDKLFMKYFTIGVIREKQNVLIINDKKYIFLTNINMFPDKIRGMRIDEYKCCNRYILDPKIRYQLDQNIVRQKLFDNSPS